MTCYDMLWRIGESEDSNIRNQVIFWQEEGIIGKNIWEMQGMQDRMEDGRQN